MDVKKKTFTIFFTSLNFTYVLTAHAESLIQQIVRRRYLPAYCSRIRDNQIDLSG